MQLFSAVPNRSALDAIGATDCGIFRPQLVFDDADSSSGDFRDLHWIGEREPQCFTMVPPILGGLAIDVPQSTNPMSSGFLFLYVPLCSIILWDDDP